MVLVSFRSFLYWIHWSQVLSREWRCSWTGDAPTTSAWSPIVLSTKVRFHIRNKYKFLVDSRHKRTAKSILFVNEWPAYAQTKQKIYYTKIAAFSLQYTRNSSRLRPWLPHWLWILWQQGLWGQHGARLAPCWPHKLCYLGYLIQVNHTIPF